MFPAALLLAVSMIVCFASPASAGDGQEAIQLVEKARFAFESFMTDAKMEPFRGLVKRARGVFISPQLLKGAFIIGVSGGRGVLVVQDERTGQWNGPCFYTIGGASFGFQIGGQEADLVLLVMNQFGIDKMLKDKVTLGADASVAAGPVGRAGTAATDVRLNAQILSYSRSRGLFAGIDVSGGVLRPDKDANARAYGATVPPYDVVSSTNVTMPAQARGFVNALGASVRATTGQK